jgi:hypothetical protein
VAQEAVPVSFIYPLPCLCLIVDYRASWGISGPFSSQMEKQV